MKYHNYTAAGAMLIAVFAGTVFTQTRSTHKPVAKKPVAIKTVLPPLDVRAAREKVSNQLANVNQFVDVLGPIAQGIETLDQSNRTKALPKATFDKNEANKQKVVAAIRNLKEGLSNLETEFRTKPDLQKYLAGIQGITDLASQAEDSAIAGKFVASKEPLRTVSQKLKDTMTALPYSPPI